MNIGQAAGASGVSAKMIRYYESIGLIMAASRTENGYRIYTAADVGTLRFVKRARTLGFSMREIERLVLLWQDKHRASADVKRIAPAHVAELQAKIEDLVIMSEALQELVAACDGSDPPDCPILRDLEGLSDIAARQHALLVSPTVFA